MGVASMVSSGHGGSKRVSKARCECWQRGEARWRMAEAATVVVVVVVVVDGHPSVSGVGEAPLLPPLPGTARRQGAMTAGGH
ncbi:hypothetical protein E2C01_036083 [Portunus trituberculatus]|uniref:Uncharacterized protein n=1 Tax=Portunus trituberculatus TaxID=210409 RepID=A0A5B7F5X0_PORTR|nr:hypothetical protein [Portunus trituberculatus]